MKRFGFMKNIRVIILIILLILSIVSISPNPFRKGAAIVAVKKDSPAYLAGIRGPTENVRPMSKEVVVEINGERVVDAVQYYRLEKELPTNVTVVLKTNKNTYFLKKEGSGLGLVVTDAPTTNVRKGLDLLGGTRVLLKPVGNATKDQIMAAIDVIRERMNVYGLSDVSVTLTEADNNYYILIEVPGANEEDVRNLVEQQGVFEARISNKTVFMGGDDIRYVCRTPDCSGIDPRSPCSMVGDQWVCRFRFSVSLSPEAAQRQAEATKDLAIITKDGQRYLNETIDFYLDNELVDSLMIGAELKGNPTTDIMISGSGVGITQEEAMRNTLNNMKKLQTILMTGSLPVKLEIAQINMISPTLGESFLKNVGFIGVLSILVVSLIMFIRYRKIAISIPAIITMVSEVILILGFAALINWRLDIAGIAGILIAIGSGVDDQIVISDEVLGKTSSFARNWKEKIKNAFYIVFGSYLTTVAAMLPLWSAGASLLRGFALTTIAGVTFGVFVTRPAFAAILEHFFK